MAHNKADCLYSLACYHLFRRHFSFVLLLIRNCKPALIILAALPSSLSFSLFCVFFIGQLVVVTSSL